jgi:hypothetical protein
VVKHDFPGDLVEYYCVRCVGKVRDSINDLEDPFRTGKRCLNLVVQVPELAKGLSKAA